MPRAATRWSLATITAVLVTSGLTGCGGDDEPSAKTSASPSASGSQGPSGVSTAQPITRPLKFDQASSITLPETGVQEAVVTGRVLLTRTEKELTARKLPDLSSAYKVAAKEGTFTDLWLSADEKSGVVVEVLPRPGQGTQLGQVRYRVTRFDAVTGKTAATATVSLRQDPRAGSTPTTARVIGLAGSTAVLDSWAAADPKDAFAASSARHATVAVDLSSKELAWSARPARPLAVTSDRVVVNTGEPSRPGEIQGLGVDAGLLQWSALPGTRVATATAPTADRVVVAASTSRTGSGTATSLALSDGGASAGSPTLSWNWACHENTGSIAVCAVGGDRVLGWDVETNTVAWRLPTDTRVLPGVTTVADGVVYGLANGAGVALDARTGQDLGTGTGSVPSSVSRWGAVSLLDSQAVFQRAVDAG